MRFSYGVKSANFGVMVVRGHLTLKEAREGFQKSHILAAFRSSDNCSGATVTLKQCMREIAFKVAQFPKRPDKIVWVKFPRPGHIDLR